jgi:2,4-dienoyl-CoA reductase (NADPH2)
VTLFEAANEVGGQFNLARRIPGKEEFAETLRYYRARLASLGVVQRLGHAAVAGDLAEFDHVVVATGVRPRVPGIAGIDHAKSVGYAEVVEGRVSVGPRVAIVGAGGIGFDVAELLSADRPLDGHASSGAADDAAIDAFRAEWGIDARYAERGGLGAVHDPAPARMLWLLQRKTTKVGEGLAKTTGWIRRTLLRKRGVQMIAGVEYERIDDAGLHIRVDGVPRVLEVDNVVICAGQEPNRELSFELTLRRIPHTLVGGADVALELDAKRAIDQATRVALAL